MIGIGNVICFSNGATELVEAMGTEVITLGSSREPAAVTLANGIKPLKRSAARWPDELLDIARRMTVTSVAHGQNHGAACNLLGAVYTWGVNDWGQLGRSCAAAEANNAVRHVASIKHQRIVQVAAGESHCVGLSDDGAVFAWGRNNEGQCGTALRHQRDVQMVMPDAQIPSAVPPEENSVNSALPYAPRDSGATLMVEFVPKYVNALSTVRIRHVTCGLRFTLFLAGKEHGGSIYACGENLCGQLGLGYVSSHVGFPTKLVAVADGMKTSVELHGGGKTSENISESKHETASAFEEVAAGAAHAIARTASGHVFTWGLNNKGQLGHGDTSSRSTPSLLLAENGTPCVAKLVAAGSYHSAMVSGHGDLLTWGACADGRLGQSHELAPSSSFLARSLEVKAVEAAVTKPQRIGPLSTGYTYKGTVRRDTESQHVQSDTTTWELPLTRSRSHQALRKRALQHSVIKATEQRAAHLAPAMLRAALTGGPEDTESLRTQVIQAFATAGMVPDNLSTLIPNTHDRSGDGSTELSESELVARAAAVGLKLSEIDVPYGVPWSRGVLPRDEAGIIKRPGIVGHPALSGRIIVALSCGENSTTVHLTTTLDKITPSTVVDSGGELLQLSGAGLASVCRLAWGQRDAASMEAHASDAKFKELEPIPGVFVRFTSTDIQPSVHTLQAYFPKGWMCQPDLDLPGGANDLTFFNNDGSLFHTNRVAHTEDVSSLPNLDTIRVISPTVPKPCKMQVEIVIRPANPVVATVLADAGVHHAIHLPLGIGARALPESPHAHAHDRTQILPGQCHVAFHAKPTITTTAPRLVKSVGDGDDRQMVHLRGKNLFGCALVDRMAADDAQRLIKEVQSAIRKREDEEADLLMHLVGIDKRTTASTTRAESPYSEDASLEGKRAEALPSGTPLFSQQADHLKSVASLRSINSQADTGSNFQGGDDTLIPTLHLEYSSGSTDLPHDALIKFEVVKRTNSSIQQLGWSDPVHGWYTVKYDESLVSVQEAVDAMTGTKAEEANAKTVISSTLNPSRSGPAKSRISAAIGTVRPEQDAVDEDDDEEEGCIGVYDATISCTLPSLPFLGAASVKEADLDSASALYTALQSQRMAVREMVAAKEANETVVVDGHTIDVGQIERDSHLPKGGHTDDGVVELLPHLSVDGGHSYFAPADAAACVLFNPEIHSVWPPLLPAHANSALSLRGSGFIPGHTLYVRFSPVWDKDAPSVTVECACKSNTSIELVVPPLPLPAEKGADAATLCGHAAFDVELSIDGKHFSGFEGAHVVTFVGEFGELGPKLVSSNGGDCKIHLPAATFPPSQYVQLSENVHIPSWLPAIARIGHPLLGVGSHITADLLKSDDPASVVASVTAICELVDDYVTIRLPAKHEVGDCRQLLVQLKIFGTAVGGSQLVSYFDPSAIHIQGVGPKKIAPGVEMSVTLEGLDVAFHGKDSAPLASPAKAKAPEVVSKSNIDTSKWQPRLRITMGGSSFIVSGRAEGSTISATLANPSCPETPVPLGDATVEASIDGGHTYTSPVNVKVVKK